MVIVCSTLSSSASRNAWLVLVLQLVVLERVPGVFGKRPSCAHSS